MPLASAIRKPQQSQQSPPPARPWLGRTGRIRMRMEAGEWALALAAARGEEAVLTPHHLVWALGARLGRKPHWLDEVARRRAGEPPKVRVRFAPAKQTPAAAAAREREFEALADAAGAPNVAVELVELVADRKA